MLNFAGKRRLGTDSIPSNLTTLSVSWLNSQFKAIAVHRGVVAGAWERPADSQGPGDFEKLIGEAVQQTGYHGQSVSLLLAHPQLMQHLLELPPAKGAALQKIIQRQAQQQKLFAGEAAWTSQMLPAGKGTQRILLHLFPRGLLLRFVQGCKANDLHLTALRPASTVLQHQLEHLPLEKDEVALLAAETAGSTIAVVGRSDGQMLLARTLPGSWNDPAGRMALDLNRTMLFVNQHYGADSRQSVWLFGPGAREQCLAVQNQTQFPVKVSPVEYDSLYWAREAVKLQPASCPNFISPELQKAPQRRIFAKVVAAATVVLLAGALVTALYAHWQARQDRQAVRIASSQIAQLENKKLELQRLDDELTRKQGVVKLLIDQRPPPAPAWLLAFLGEAVPSDLLVTNLQITRQDNAWKVMLAGKAQAPVKSPAFPPLAASLETLKTRLSAAPFFIRFTEEQLKAKPQAGDRVQSGWLNGLTSESLDASQQAAQTAPKDRFVLQGIMQ